MQTGAGVFLSLGTASFILTGLLTWPTRLLAIRLGTLDKPDLIRKMQTEPVPYLGGIAIALGISIITFAAVYIGGENSAGENEKQLVDLAATVLFPAMILGVIGLIDDLRSLSPWPRLIAQTVVGTVLSIIIVENGTTGTPFGDGNSFPHVGNISWLNTLVTIFWIVGICNSINFFDNLDGAASGTVAIAALGIFFIAFDRGQELVSALSIVTAGATIGFLIWNKSPAKIYMGDAGALFIGVVISVATIRLNPGITPNWQSLAIPIMLLAVPLLDTCVAVFSRVKRGSSPMTGGRDHLSHRLIASGYTKKKAAIILWCASGVCSIFAVSVYFHPGQVASYLIAIFGLTLSVAFMTFSRMRTLD